MPRYILMPLRGVRVNPAQQRAFDLMIRGSGARSTLPPVLAGLPLSSDKSISVLDSIYEDGPKLIDTDEQNLVELRRHGLKALPLEEYGLALGSRFNPNPPSGSATGPDTVITIESGAGRLPIAAATVTVFTSLAANEGAQGITDIAGEVRLKLGAHAVTADRLFVEPPLVGFWGKSLSNLSLPATLTVQLDAAAPGFNDSLTHYYSRRSLQDGQGVRIGIVDTGVDTTHPDLAHITSGSNVATGEPRTQWQDNGTGHGTHVAGIVSGRGPIGASRMTGLAPASDVHVFRAFGQNKRTTTNFEILKGIIRACDADCHLINLSLSGEARTDETLRQGIEAARDQGVLVIAAAGNSGRKPPTIPGLFAANDGICVSAFGKRACFPIDSFESVDVASPFGTFDPDSFLAAFTNVSRITLTAPGVGVISTVPGGYGPMSGTSMACPVVTAIAARILSDNLNQQNPVLRRSPDVQRTIDMISLVTMRAQKVFSDPNVEGDGMLI